MIAALEDGVPCSPFAPNLPPAVKLNSRCYELLFLVECGKFMGMGSLIARRPTGPPRFDGDIIGIILLAAGFGPFLGDMFRRGSYGLLYV